MSKKLIASAIFAVAFVATSTAYAADLGTTTLKFGMKSTFVSNLQTALGVTPVTGYFGNITKAKVMAFQKDHGLVADGVVGAMTKAAINATSTPTTPTDTTTPTTSTKLNGAEGSITVSDFTSGTETTLGEGKSEKVLGVKLSADEGSDLAINTIKVELKHASGTGSTRAERYFDSADIYMGSTKVGSADVSDFSKNSTGLYTKTISLSNAVVKMDSDVKFYVQLNAADTIDSENQADHWDVSVTSVRYTDAMGVVSTEAVSTSEVATADVDFEDSTANDEVSTSSSSNNPEATTLKVKDDGVSDEYMVFAFKVKAGSDSSDLNVLEIPISVATNATDADAERVVNDIYLKVGSTTYDNYDFASNAYTFSIDEGDFTIDAGTTAEVKVYAKFNKEGLSSTYLTGKYATFSLDASKMVVENIDGDSVSTATVTDRTGNKMTLSTGSVVVSSVTTSSTVDSDGKLATFTFKFTVEADGDDVTLDNSTIAETVAGPEVVTPTFSIKKDSGTATGTLGTSYVVADGDTASFTVTYTVNPTTSTGVYYVTMDNVAGVTVDKTAGPETITTA